MTLNVLEVDEHNCVIARLGIAEFEAVPQWMDVLVIDTSTKFIVTRHAIGGWDLHVRRIAGDWKPREISFTIKAEIEL